MQCALLLFIMKIEAIWLIPSSVFFIWTFNSLQQMVKVYAMSTIELLCVTALTIWNVFSKGHTISRNMFFFFIIISKNIRSRKIDDAAVVFFSTFVTCHGIKNSMKLQLLEASFFPSWTDFVNWGFTIKYRDLVRIF